MLMVWAVLLMSITVMGVVEYISYSLEGATLASAEFRALHLAESGLAVGLHPNTQRGDVVLKQKVGPDSGFDVVINYEGARIPINFITDERLQEAVYNLFVYWGLNSDEATIAMESLADWVDRDTDARSNGAEAEYYESFGSFDIPRQQGFLSVEEMIQVRGMGIVDQLKTDWREYFSVYGDGTIDVRTAFKDVLLAITQASEADVDRFIRERDGSDGIPGTEDDRDIGTNEAFQLLGLSGSEAAGLNGVLSDDDEVRRVTSTGYVADKRAQIVVIARSGEDQSLTYLGRIEE
jgi:hypothetical protein